jgi:hypothetical protein
LPRTWRKRGCRFAQRGRPAVRHQLAVQSSEHSLGAAGAKCGGFGAQLVPRDGRYLEVCTVPRTAARVTPCKRYAALACISNAAVAQFPTRGDVNIAAPIRGRGAAAGFAGGDTCAGAPPGRTDAQVRPTLWASCTAQGVCATISTDTAKVVASITAKPSVTSTIEDL